MATTTACPDEEPDDRAHLARLIEQWRRSFAVRHEEESIGKTFEVLLSSSIRNLDVKQMRFIRNSLIHRNSEWDWHLSTVYDPKTGQWRLVPTHRDVRANNLEITTTRKGSRLVARDDVPQRAQEILYFILPKKDRDSLLGDLREEYITKIIPTMGPRKAHAWYWKQVIWSIAPVLRGQVYSLLRISIIVKAVYWIWGRS